MAKAVVILHPSKVIRIGLLHAIENDIRTKIICKNSLSELDDNLFTTFTDILLITPLNDKLKVLSKLEGHSNQFYLIGIEYLNSNSGGNSFDFVYNLDSPIEELLSHVKAFLDENGENEIDDELTIREREVLRLIALGHTNKSIAETLFISTHTVISHRKNITEKLGIKSIPGLTVYALIQKIITQSDISKEHLH